MKSAYEIINDSVKAVKATLFGKFYEKIILSGSGKEKDLYHLMANQESTGKI